LPSALFARDQSLNGTSAVLGNNTAWEAGGLSHKASLAADASAVAEQLITQPPGQKTSRHGLP
jgi:hypothetical protein